ncbi:MAG: cytochrome c biogenesis protein CcsA [Bacteroidetes bacterium]|nr:cytochrome c biogenesis protein CcsA [Bacteroidota bacterium]
MDSFKRHWWKGLGVILLIYTIIAGFLIQVPDLPIIHQSIRNLFFHVCMWFSMIFYFGVSMVYSIRYLSGFKEDNDRVADEASHVGLLFGLLGIVTGMIWANFTWGKPWVNDPQLNGAAVSILVYLAYRVLRNSLDEEHKRAKVSAVYNIFAFVILVIFLFILPKMAEGSLHPGKGKDETMTVKELDNTMRLVFYPAIIGWIILGGWILQLRIRIRKLSDQAFED